MKRIFTGILCLALLVVSFSGCSSSLPDAENPVTLTMWHVYGSQTHSPLNTAIDEFNRTVGEGKIDPLLLVPVFIRDFLCIHPFIDGNGRTGRLIMNLDLIRNGFPPINVKFTDRKRYYDAFEAYYKENNPTPMIELIAEYVDKRFDDYFGVLVNNF